MREKEKNIKIISQTYRNEDDFLQFEKEKDVLYNKKVDEIVSMINSKASSDEERLWLLFSYFTNEDMEYDLYKISNGSVYHPGYKLLNYDFKITQNEKYPAVLFNKGVCITFSKAFEDICNNKLNIPCRIVYGSTGIEHAWNIVLLDGEVKHIDIAYALMNRNRIDKSAFFLQSLEDIKKFGGNRDVSSNMLELKNEMLNQYKNIHSQIRIISKIDNNDLKKGRIK